MTFKELSKKLNTTIQTVQNLVQVLSTAFNDIEGGGGGSDVYSDSEKLVGVWQHDDITEDVYEKTFSLDNISTSSSNPDELLPATYILLDVKPTGIYTISGTNYIFDDLIFVNSINTDSYNLRLSLQKGSTNYTIHKEGSGDISNATLTLRYVKRTE